MRYTRVMLQGIFRGIILMRMHIINLCAVCWKISLIVLMVMGLLSGCQTPAIVDEFVITPSIITLGTQMSAVDVAFRLNQSAAIDITLVNGSSYTIHHDAANLVYPAGRHTFRFTGLVEGYVMGDEIFPFQVVQRLVPGGNFRVVIMAESNQSLERVDLPLIVINEGVEIPVITHLEVKPTVITPNEDGMDDAAMVTIGLEKAVAQMSVYAISESGAAYPIPELEGEAMPNAAGTHKFHFDPLEIVGESIESGSYTISANVYDAYRQHIRWNAPLEVANTGQSYGYIVDGAVTYSADSVKLGETLCFSLTVLNSGDTYMRTTGPWSSTTYQQSENFVTLQFPEDKGIFRVGLDFDSSEGQYPYRWALGSQNDLAQIDGEWYLLPHTAAVVNGCVRFDELPDSNPQYLWVGLIHEQSTVPLVNHRVAPMLIYFQPE